MKLKEPYCWLDNKIKPDSLPLICVFLLVLLCVVCHQLHRKKQTKSHNWKKIAATNTLGRYETAQQNCVMGTKINKIIEKKIHKQEQNKCDDASRYSESKTRQKRQENNRAKKKTQQVRH